MVKLENKKAKVRNISIAKSQYNQGDRFLTSHLTDHLEVGTSPRKTLDQLKREY